MDNNMSCSHMPLEQVRPNLSLFLVACLAGGCSFYSTIPMLDAQLTLHVYEQIPLGEKWTPLPFSGFVPAGKAGALSYSPVPGGGYAFVTVVLDKEGRVASKSAAYSRPPDPSTIAWACAFWCGRDSGVPTSRASTDQAPPTGSDSSSDQEKTPPTDESVWKMVAGWTQAQDLKMLGDPNSISSIDGMLRAHGMIMRRCAPSYPKDWQEKLNELIERYFEGMPTHSHYSMAFVLARMRRQYGQSFESWPKEGSGSGVSDEGWPHREWWWFRRPGPSTTYYFYAYTPR